VIVFTAEPEFLLNTGYIQNHCFAVIAAMQRFYVQAEYLSKCINNINVMPTSV